LVNSAPLDPEDPLLRALAQYWDEVLSLADDEQRLYLLEIVAGTADPDPVNARAALADLLLDVLPPDHPMVRLLLAGTMFRRGGDGPSGNSEDLALSWSRLRALVLTPDGSPEPIMPMTAAGPPPGLQAAISEFDRRVQSRLLRLPFHSPEELRGRDIDPDVLGLIRLTRQDRGVQLPAFQFAPTGEPWPAVVAVNELLGAAADPWGVTCWWVDPHAGLGGVPADLLGQGQDDLLLKAAAAVGAD
jgi:hypothetical protein